MCRNSDPAILVSCVLLFWFVVCVKEKHLSWEGIFSILLCLFIAVFRAPPGNVKPKHTCQSSVHTQTPISVNSDQALRKYTICKIPTVRKSSALGQEFETLWVGRGDFRKFPRIFMHIWVSPSMTIRFTLPCFKISNGNLMVIQEV